MANTSSNEVSLANLIAQATANKGVRDGLNAQIEAARQEAQTQSVLQADALEAQGLAAQAAIAEKGRIELERSARILRARDAINLDELLVQGTAKMADMRQRLDQEGEDIDARMSTKFTDDPFEWIYNQFSLGGRVQAYNSHANTYNRKEQEIQGLTDMAVRARTAIDHTTATTSEKLLKADLDTKQSETSAKVAELRIKAAHDNFQAFVTQQQLVGLNLKEALEVKQVAISAANLSINQQQLTLAQERATREKAMNELDLFIKNRSVDELKAVDKMLQKASIILRPPGAPAITATEFQNYDPKARMAIMNLTATGTLGTEWDGAREALKNLGYRPTNPIQGQLIQAVDAYWANMQKPNPQVGHMSPAQLSEFANKQVFTKAEVDLNKRTVDSPESWYKAPSLAGLNNYILAEKQQSVQTVPLWQRYFSGIVAGDTTGSMKLDGKLLTTVMNTAYADLVKSGVDKDKAAAQVADQVATIAKTAASYNNDTNNYQLLGLPSQVGYRVAGESGLFSSAPIYDLTKPVEIQRMLLQSETARMRAAGNVPSNLAAGPLFR